MPAIHSCQGNPRQSQSENVDGNTRLALDPLMQPWHSCLASLRSRFFSVRDARVRGSRVSPGCRLMSRAIIESSWQEGRESHSPSLILGNSSPRLSPNALNESVQPALRQHHTHFRSSTHNILSNYLKFYPKYLKNSTIIFPKFLENFHEVFVSNFSKFLTTFSKFVLIFLQIPPKYSYILVSSKFSPNLM